MVPAIFLGVTAFLIHNVLLRLVALQREQIGVLKAFGYGDRFAIAAHFRSWRSRRCSPAASPASRSASGSAVGSPPSIASSFTFRSSCSP